MIISKGINIQNWLEQDPENDFSKRTSVNRRLHDILGPKLLESVPSDVQALFETARAALIYGSLFYPLYTLGTEQLTRVAEAAAFHRCKDLQAPKDITQASAFEKKIEWLASKGALQKDFQKDLWSLVRKWRNTASHPTSTLLIDHDMAILVLRMVEQLINDLFPAKSSK